MVGFEPSSSEPLTTNPCRRVLPDFLPPCPIRLDLPNFGGQYKRNFTSKTLKMGAHISRDSDPPVWSTFGGHFALATGHTLGDLQNARTRSSRTFHPLSRIRTSGSDGNT